MGFPSPPAGIQAETPLHGTPGSDKKGFFVHPTIIETSDPKSVTMVEEIFGPVLTVRGLCTLILGRLVLMVFALQVYVYEDADYEKAIDLCDSTTEYALTGAM